MMARPRKTVTVPFEMLFPLLVYYLAQVVDKQMGGEWSTDLSWKKLCRVIDENSAITLTSSQLEHLIYSYKCGVVDRRKPFQILKWFAKNYHPLMQQFLETYPDLFKKDKDNEITVIGETYEETPGPYEETKKPRFYE